MNAVAPRTAPAPSDPEAPPEPARPFVSVLLMASRHREFVSDAIASLHSQTLPPSEWELVIAHDYDDPALERARGDLAGGSVRVPPGDIGPAIAAGVQAARGEVLSFLDDDDRFRPEKLASVAAAFRGDPDLGFYRNNFRIIDPNGVALPAHPFRATHRRNASQLGPRTLSGPARMEELRTLPPVAVDFNSSCMAVRAKPLQRLIAKIDLRGFRLLDELAFFAVLTSPMSLRLDPAALTEYRVHGRNASIRPTEHEDPLASRAEFARVVAPSYARLADAVRSTGDRGATDEAEGLRLSQEAFLAMRDPLTPRAEFRRLRRALTEYRSTYLVRSERGLGAALRLFALAPRLARWMYAREVRRQSS